MLPEVVRDQIRSEVQQIDEIFQEFADLLEKAGESDPTIVERAALGTVLHSFYTGLEGIFLTVAKRIDGQIPAGNRWHRDLLDQVSSATDRRNAVISEETKSTLQEYLAFRHFFRQAYSYVLSWEEMRDLVDDLGSTWRRSKAEIEAWEGSQ